jgi:hypothetical protein
MRDAYCVHQPIRNSEHHHKARHASDFFFISSIGCALSCGDLVRDLTYKFTWHMAHGSTSTSTRSNKQQACGTSSAKFLSFSYDDSAQFAFKAALVAALELELQEHQLEAESRAPAPGFGITSHKQEALTPHPERGSPRGFASGTAGFWARQLILSPNNLTPAISTARIARKGGGGGGWGVRSPSKVHLCLQFLSSGGSFFQRAHRTTRGD